MASQAPQLPQPRAADLHFERKNQDMVKLPKYAKINKRPIPHAPISSPYAGPSVPKIIYVSSSTPYMSAVKRVQKLLRQAEKRATASIVHKNKNNRNQSRNAQSQSNRSQGTKEETLLAALARGEEREQLNAEEVFVKATGKAMDTALRVGRWFQRKEREAEYKVRVSTGSVLVVDDVEEDESERERILSEAGKVNGDAIAKDDSENKAAAGAGDETTVLTTTTGSGEGDTTIMTDKSGETATAMEPKTANPSAKPLSKSALRKRKRAAGLAASLADTELPESRTRWVNSVEVAVSLK
ncbi:Rpp20 subunit of nuclear RNase MRP and P-domain-containing protein [Aspergillus unguis]